MAGLLEGDVADDARLAVDLHAVDADVEDHRPRLDPVTAHETGPTDRDDEDIGSAAKLRRVPRARMGDGHRAVFRKQQLRHRLADNVGFADHHGMEAGEVFAEPVLQQHEAAERRAGHQCRLAGRKAPGIGDMEAVDIFVGIDALDDGVGIEMDGQRQLHENAVHGGIDIQPVDQRHQLVLRRVGRKLVLEGIHAGGDRLAVLRAHIDGTGGICADKDDGKARHGAGRLFQPGNVLGDVFEQAGRELLAVDDRAVRDSIHSHDIPLLRHSMPA